jgi:hypothetical protein
LPLFLYLLHIPLIHGGAILLGTLRFDSSPLAHGRPWDVKEGAVPSAYGVSLPIVYMIWTAVLVVLYPACQWFADVKRRRREP